MIRVQLPDADVGRLGEAARTADATFRDRARILLMAHRGRPHQGIAADLGVTPRTVQRWLNADLAGGLDGLRPRKAEGKPGVLPAALADEVERWVTEGPAEQGLDRANWTHGELADHPLKAKGSRTSRSAVRRFCSRIGVRPYRPTYRFPRADPVKPATARGELAGPKTS
jgi:transposase